MQWDQKALNQVNLEGITKTRNFNLSIFLQNLTWIKKRIF